jgi:hypothetical protein
MEHSFIFSDLIFAIFFIAVRACCMSLLAIICSKTGHFSGRWHPIAMKARRHAVRDVDNRLRLA